MLLRNFVREFGRLWTEAFKTVGGRGEVSGTLPVPSEIVGVLKKK